MTDKLKIKLCIVFPEDTSDKIFITLDYGLAYEVRKKAISNLGIASNNFVRAQATNYCHAMHEDLSYELAILEYPNMWAKLCEKYPNIDTLVNGIKVGTWFDVLNSTYDELLSRVEHGAKEYHHLSLISTGYIKDYPCLEI